MIERMNRTGHLGAEFLRGTHISDYVPGTKHSMDDYYAEEALINIHRDGVEIAALFASSLFPSRFGKITHPQVDKLLRGKIPKRWTVAAVCLVM